MMLNPIFESSARRRMRTVKTPLILTAYTAALLILSLCQLTPFFGQGLEIWRMRRSTETYIWLTALQFFLIVLVAPALSAGSIAGERERQTFDLLLVTGVGVRRIVLGKMLENFAFLVLLILCGLPVMMLCTVTGGLPASALLTTMLFLLAIALSALSVGMVISVLMRRSLSAIILAYLAVFAIGAGTWVLAKHGPVAAAYSIQDLSAIVREGGQTALWSIPLVIFFNPAVGLVMLLSSQTGILHNTMQYTMRLQDIYIVAKAAGFADVAKVSFAAILFAAVLLMVLAAMLLHMQTGSVHTRKRKAEAEMETK